MRELTSHKVNPANDKLKIEVLDEPGSGGAHHLYVISGFAGEVGGPDCFMDWLEANPDADNCVISFQSGPIAEAGVNGITHEALLAILIDRMECFEKGPFASEYNKRALFHLYEAQSRLLDRTRERMSRGVEGTHQK